MNLNGKKSFLNLSFFILFQTAGQGIYIPAQLLNNTKQVEDDLLTKRQGAKAMIIQQGV